MNKEEKAALKKKYEEPLTKRYFITLFVGLIIIAIAIYLYIHFSESVANYFPKGFGKSVIYFGIGAIWTFQIQQAWYKKND